MLHSIFDTLLLALEAPPILAASDSETNALPYLLFLSGFVFYGYVFLRYRNADKRHKHEKETEAELQNVRVRDDYQRTLKGLSNARMKGANHTSVRGSLNSPMGGVSGAVKKFMK